MCVVLLTDNRFTHAEQKFRLEHVTFTTTWKVTVKPLSLSKQLQLNILAYMSKKKKNLVYINM